MDNAVTVIVGAGAVLDFEHKGIFPSVCQGTGTWQLGTWQLNPSQVQRIN